MWTSAGVESGIDVHPDVCVAIPAGTAFQVRAYRHDPLAAVAATMPPWPGEGEAQIVVGPSQATLTPEPH